jgi:Flp pilus assembly protein TadG
MARRNERGAIAIWAVLVATLLFALVAYGLNIGHAAAVKAELQNASDGAALGAAHALNGQATGITAARAAAASYASEHVTDSNVTVNINSVNDVQFCKWNMVTNTQVWCLGWGVAPTSAGSPDDATMPQLLATNAVRVRDGREASRGNALPVYLGGFLGAPATVDDASVATAVGAGPSTLTQCSLPLAYVDCAFGSTSCGSTLIYRNNNTDTGGFTLLDTGNVSANGLKYFLDNLIANGTCIKLNVGASISMNNGNISAANVWNDFKQLVGREWAIPIVHSSDCKINSSHLYPIDGFATVLITGVYRNNGDSPPPACGGTTPCITANVTCSQTVNEAPGGGFFGLSTVRTQLVQ